jgi:hypothetical protein
VARGHVTTGLTDRYRAPHQFIPRRGHRLEAQAGGSGADAGGSFSARSRTSFPQVGEQAPIPRVVLGPCTDIAQDSAKLPSQNVDFPGLFFTEHAGAPLTVRPRAVSIVVLLDDTSHHCDTKNVVHPLAGSHGYTIALKSRRTGRATVCLSGVHVRYRAENDFLTFMPRSVS